MTRKILVCGATGKQGGALVRALLEHPDDDFEVLAITRNAASPSAQNLASMNRIDVVQVNLDEKESVAKVFEDARKTGSGIWGVFCVLAFPGLGASGDGEERQGKLLANLALEYGVEAFIYSSSMRAGPRYDKDMKLSSKAKVNVEAHCVELGRNGLKWIFLQPGFFLENFDDTIGTFAVGILKQGLKEEIDIAFIGSEDIGGVAAGVFRNHKQYIHKVLSVVGEFATMSQLEEAHQKATGKSISSIPATLAWALIKFNKSTRALIENIELNYRARTQGDFPECDSEIALACQAFKIKNCYEWFVAKKIAEDSRKNEIKTQDRWNHLSLQKLLAGKL